MTQPIGVKTGKFERVKAHLGFNILYLVASNRQSKGQTAVMANLSSSGSAAFLLRQLFFRLESEKSLLAHIGSSRLQAHYTAGSTLLLNLLRGPGDPVVRPAGIRIGSLPGCGVCPCVNY